MIEPQHPLVCATADTPAGVRDRRISAPIRFSVPLFPREEINHVATPLGQRARQHAVLSVLRQQLANHLENKAAGVLFRATCF